MNAKSPHILFGSLIDYQENRLHCAEREETFAHLSDCADCASQLARVERTISLMRGDVLEDAPAHTIARAKTLLPQHYNTAPSKLQRVLAALRFDSHQMEPAFGVRAEQAASRQLIFSAENHNVDLRITPEGEVWKVSGQVLGACSGGQVELCSATFAAEASLNDLCEFTFSPVPSGLYTLTLRMSHLEVTATDLQLGA